MDHYTPHCFHRGLETFKVPAGKESSPVEMIDVRSAKIFFCWIKADFEGEVFFDYYWDDKKTMLFTATEATGTIPGKFVPVTFGTYKGSPLPAMFLQLRVRNDSGTDGEVMFGAIAQLQ